MLIQGLIDGWGDVGEEGEGDVWLDGGLCESSLLQGLVETCIHVLAREKGRDWVELEELHSCVRCVRWGREREGKRGNEGGQLVQEE